MTNEELLREQIAELTELIEYADRIGGTYIGNRLRVIRTNLQTLLPAREEKEGE